MNYESYLSNLILFLNTSAELVFTFSKSTINTVEQVRQYAQSNELRHQDKMSFFIGLMSCCYLWTDCAPMLTLSSQIPAGVIAPILAVSVNQKV